ncbi:uncharacterized protein PV07_07751 [Cladophialophora immunda]|uniref:Restriction endonuclease domain-containing protein n=1 Tax=Cladophialophora immunda TaxID=569365 RepID=A0A0D2ASH5_9EURO|nr:uncharacterized protein PV07_07751 [Cladophialophora immunda]KIW28067.1 hypothetical protein PV07_07751 [Cladophialophora immunda]
MESEHPELPETPATHETQSSAHLCNPTVTPQQRHITAPHGFSSTVPQGLDPAYTALELIIREVKARKSGLGPRTFQPWMVFPLAPTDLRALDLYFQGDGYWEDKVRCDYFGSSQLFVLRLHSNPHEVIRAEVRYKLVSCLRTLPGRCPDEASGRFAHKICDCGSATVELAVGTHYSRHDPDISFRHPAAAYPGVIIEIASSQKAEALEQLANDYICGSSGKIHVVIGIEMEFGGKKGAKSRKATFSVWKPQWTTQDGKQSVHAECTAREMFRNEKGVPNLDAELSFSLSEFAPQAVVDRFEGFVDHTVQISAKELCAYCESAEQLEARTAEVEDM